MTTRRVSIGGDRAPRGGVQRDRRMRSTSGNRAWTEAEEAYVLQARSQKTPYKKIAAQLHKTELACRLHYHQMSYGRKKSWGGRNGSTSSSVASISHSPEPMWPSQQQEQYRHEPTASLQAQQPQFQVPILPKPRAYSMASPHYEAEARRKQSLMSMNEMEYLYACPIDNERVRHLYEKHRNHFWSIIAAEYSKESDVSPSPAILEHSFFENVRRPSIKYSVPQQPLPEWSPMQLPFRFHNSNGIENAQAPPTPPNQTQQEFMPYRAERMQSIVSTNGCNSTPSTVSPASSPNSSSHTNKCAVSSLLTVERDVWRPKEIKAI
ncbi:hypothetical protein AAP_04934 [Ascosphaera apis ARSEF 7405]|uniref:Myb-like domain-containing protein n=1 Tax=Ascosphaera apis ARSEF 7405 TaxID=392613 RepID=A0A167WAU9_9EURO|nr:hypothetical protein AAP_04934 [Ascosphaera apis ARSEF 7405]